MANKTIPDIFNEVAKAIQKKTGETSALDPVDFSQKIEDIPQEIIIHGDMDKAFDEAVGDAIWNDGYFLGYYNKSTKEVRIDLEPIMCLDTNDPATWIPSICSSGSITAHDVGIQEISENESQLAELNAYNIEFDSESEPNLGTDQFLITQLSMGSSSTEKFMPTGVIESAKYKKLSDERLYNITSSGATWNINALTTKGELYLISSGGYAKMKFINDSGKDIISSDPTIYKYLGDSNEDEFNKLYDIGSDKGLYVIDSGDSSLIYKAYTDKALPADGDVLQAQVNEGKLELVEYENPLDSGYFYYYDGTSFYQQNVYSDRPYYSDGESLIELDIPEGLQYIYKDSAYAGGYEFENANIDADYAYEYDGRANFSRIDSGLYYINYGCEGVQEITNVSEGDHYTYNGYGSFEYYDAFSGLSTGTVYNYDGGESFTALNNYSLYYISNDCGDIGYEEITNVYTGCVYAYLGHENFSALDSNSLYKIDQNGSTDNSYEKISLPSTQGDTTTIIIDGYSYTITNNGQVE